jgi:hypothetical protein
MITSEQAQRWTQVLLDRHSVRTFDGAPLDRTAARALTDLTPEPLGGALGRAPCW